MRFCKTLLLSRTLPGIGHVGEIVLADLVKYVGSDNFHCVAPVSSKYTYRPDPALSGLSINTISTDHLEARRWGRGRWGAIGSFINYRTGFQAEVARCTREIVDAGMKAGVEQVFAVLENPFTFALAHRVASSLETPMATLVWDPPEYLLRKAGFDRFSRRSLLGEFRRSLASSHRVAVVSDAMRRAYAAFTTGEVGILRHGLSTLETSEALSAASLSGDEWLIGFAGSMYGSDAWAALLNALDQVSWRLAGRPVRIRLLTGKITLRGRHGARIDYLGFRPPVEMQELLSGCHLTYLPQPFSPFQRDLCQFAFPNKLSNYLAIGRPVFVHAPDEGALSQFVKNNPIGVRATSLAPDEIISAMEQILFDARLYDEMCANVGKVAGTFFSRNAFESSVDSFLGLDADEALPCAASPAS